ncbi:MAG: glutaredoxin 3 [Pseudomonadota bacterium]
MTDVTMYTTRFCPYCMAARRLLKAKGVDYDEIAVDGDRALRQKMEQISGQRTVPQIWVGEKHVGGFTDLADLDGRGELDTMLAAAQSQS